MTPKKPKLQGDAPLTPWELEKVRSDVAMAARYLGGIENLTQQRNASLAQFRKGA